MSTRPKQSDDYSKYPHAIHVVIDREHLKKHSQAIDVFALASAEQQADIRRWSHGHVNAPVLVFGRARTSTAKILNVQFGVVYCEDAETAVKALLAQVAAATIACAQRIELTEYFVMLSNTENRRVVKAALASLPDCGSVPTLKRKRERR